jgi:protein required for attachment to host cells
MVANAARARLFERDPDNGALRELASFVHPASRVKAGALDSDRPGHVAKGQASTGLEPRTTALHREQEHFARELAQYVESAARDNRLQGWALVASNPFLGRLLGVLDESARALLREHAERDLTAYSGRDLERRIAALLAPGGADATS